MNLGVVIVSYNVRDLLHVCLTSLYYDIAHTPELQATVVVVDNNSPDDSADMVAEVFPEVELITTGENLGFAGGTNRGLSALGFGTKPLQATRPDAILLLNPDTELHTGALATLTRFMADTPRAGGCGARLTYGDGSFQHSAFRFPGLTQLFLDLYPLHHWLIDTPFNGRYPRRRYSGTDPFSVDFLLGAALMVRSDVIDTVGLLDESYFMYAEEMDWCRRIQDAGWPLYCIPTAHITHYEGQSARQFRSLMTVALWRSRLRYYETYYASWKRRAARLLISLGMKSHAKRARSAYTHGQYDADELQNRLAAYRQVRDLL